MVHTFFFNLFKYQHLLKQNHLETGQNFLHVSLKRQNIKARQNLLLIKLIRILTLL